MSDGSGLHSGALGGTSKPPPTPSPRPLQSSRHLVSLRGSRTVVSIALLRNCPG
ncbi:MAG: hypothetical protein QW529_06190 [Sulfolobales archaeon]